jgi:putative ABC transport system substrate-binding protein
MWYRTVGGIVTLILSLLVVPLAVEAQPLAGKVPRLGFLSTAGSPPPPCSPPDVLPALHELGYVEGQTISIAWRCAEGQADRIRQFAGELVQLGVDVLVSDGRAGTLALKAATKTIPIVFRSNGDPVPEIVPNLAHPGGNVTGVTNIAGQAFFAKPLELLLEAVPRVTRVALLLVAGDPFNADRTTPVETAARAVGVQVHRVEVAGPDAFERAFAAMAHQGVDGLLVSFTPLFGTHSAQLGELAAKYRLPAIYTTRAFAVQGGLMAYYPVDLGRAVASYVDRILKGAKPAALPVQLPTKYALVINLKTAKALGITIPPPLLVLADEVLQ